MQPPRIIATLASGRRIVGPIGGSGGMLGAGVAYPNRAQWALRRLESIQRCYPWSKLFIYPGYSAAGDGEPVEIPLKGTRFEVCPEQEPA